MDAENTSFSLFMKDDATYPVINDFEGPKFPSDQILKKESLKVLQALLYLSFHLGFLGLFMVVLKSYY